MLMYDSLYDSLYKDFCECFLNHWSIILQESYLGGKLSSYIDATPAGQQVGYKDEDIFGINLMRYLRRSGIIESNRGPGQHIQYKGSLTNGSNIHQYLQAIKFVSGCK